MLQQVLWQKESFSMSSLSLPTTSIQSMAVLASQQQVLWAWPCLAPSLPALPMLRLLGSQQ